jgi:DNA polymerase III delta subunit
MVKKQPYLYLFLGEDPLSKDIKLKNIKEGLIEPSLEQFNLDILYARESNLRKLQERFLCLPFRAQKRLIVIKDAQALKEDQKEFILNYSRKPSHHLVVILDFTRHDPKDGFVDQLKRYAQLVRFKEFIRPDTFLLCRQINFRKADYALRTLDQLLDNGEKPEWILGGLRYATQRDVVSPPEKRRRLKAILHCDIDIKTGRLKANFALEKLVVSLCAANQSFGKA